VGSSQQPYVHDLVICLAAPTVLLSDADGQIRARGGQGMLHADVRVLSRAEVSVGAYELVPVVCGQGDAGSAEFVAVVRGLGNAGSDPTVRIERRRRVRPGRVDESFRLVSHAAEAISTDVTMILAADLTSVNAVRSGDPQPPARPRVNAAGVEWRQKATRIVVSTDDPVLISAEDDGNVTLRWDVQVDPAWR